ncbi:hypothetical protein V6C27_11600 [Peptococcaceae bacterium 1198_IL3148]
MPRKSNLNAKKTLMDDHFMSVSFAFQNIFTAAWLEPAGSGKNE